MLFVCHCGILFHPHPSAEDPYRETRCQRGIAAYYRQRNQRVPQIGADDCRTSQANRMIKEYDLSGGEDALITITAEDL